jgi:hypothetical protein
MEKIVKLDEHMKDTLDLILDTVDEIKITPIQLKELVEKMKQ